MDENYIGLKAILDEAFERASSGKGKERHANDEPFEQQWIIQGGLKYGTGALFFQLRKKLDEHERLGDVAGDNELLDVMVYAAAAIKVRRMCRAILDATHEEGRLYLNPEERLAAQMKLSRMINTAIDSITIANHPDPITAAMRTINQTSANAIGSTPPRPFGPFGPKEARVVGKENT